MRTAIPVRVTIDPEWRDDLEDVVIALAGAGLTIGFIFPETGLITGHCEAAAAEGMRAVPGVQHVYRQRKSSASLRAIAA